MRTKPINQMLTKVKTDHSNQFARIDSPSSASLRFTDFEVLNVIGQGSSGQVLLVRHMMTKQVYAMKKMSKQRVLKKNKLSQVQLEREILRDSAHSHNTWIVQLLYSFQDDYYVYLLLEYMGGGDMMTWLINKNIFTEDETKFYIAELVLALESVHSMGYVHRDVKPDNILLDNNGHIKLTDFGLCKQYEGEMYDREEISIINDGVAEKALNDQHKNRSLVRQSDEQKRLFRNNYRRRLLYSTVGSPGYIAPEVLLKQGYGFECDWWSVGVIMYEMIYGITPFYDENAVTILQKTIHWKRFLEFPDDIEASEASIDLIRNLLCDAPDRIGTRVGGIDEIKNHPFFAGIDWQSLRAQNAPFRPVLNSDIDTKYFDDFGPYTSDVSSPLSSEVSFRQDYPSHLTNI
jgi:serine/threonine kinase 38